MRAIRGAKGADCSALILNAIHGQFCVCGELRSDGRHSMSLGEGGRLIGLTHLVIDGERLRSIIPMGHQDEKPGT
jgi:hypothetical protein